MKGFTFIEFILVIAILVILVTLTLPLGISFYKDQQLNATADEVLQILRRAYLEASSQSDHSFGVYVGTGNSGQYILFRGDSYSSHDYEEIFNVSRSIYFEGISEVVFSKLSGQPSVTGNIIITDKISSVIININEVGRIGYISSQGCWGIGGSCDPGCSYLYYGLTSDYYITPTPDCSSSCPVAGSVYLNPSGNCSDDGTGSCYKMENPSEYYFSCSTFAGCESGCAGTAVPCDLIEDPFLCNRQIECRWLDKPRRCTGKSLPCSDEIFNNQFACENQLGCSWETTKWYWELGDLREGYPSYANCEWYVQQ